MITARRVAHRGAWICLNILQALATVAWTVLLVPCACVALILYRRLPLAMARHLWARGMLLIGGVRLEVDGRANVDRRSPQIFVANHESMVDIPVVFRALPVDLRFILKKELAYILPIGIFAWATGMIFVDRRKKEAARASLRRVARLGRKGPGSIMAFPEGTRSRGRGILPFKKGVFIAAIQAQLPVVPLCIWGANEVLPSDGFRVRPGTIRVKIGKPIPTTGLTLQHRDDLVRDVRQAVIALHHELTASHAAQPA